VNTFDLVDVRDYAASLHARLERCDNGEGMECANLDDAMQYHAQLCCELRDKIRRWGREVFAGRVAFDPEVEKVWLDEAFRLYDSSIKALAYGQSAQEECFVLEGAQSLRAALWDLGCLLQGWRSPKLSVGPSARLGLTLQPAAAVAARQRIESLPPLPADWTPLDATQQRNYSKLRKLRNRQS
jgi:hypothetical protein